MNRVTGIITAIFVFFNTAVFASYKEALSLYEEKKYKESLEIIAAELDINKDMEKDSPNYDLRFLAAHNHWQLGNITSAISHFKRCSEIRKDSADPLLDLSFLLLDAKRYGDAAYFAGQAVKISESPLTYYLLGKSAKMVRNFWKAKEYFEKSISLDPEFGISYNELGMVLMHLKKYSEANTAFSAALISLPDSPEVLNNMAINYEIAGRINEAIKYFTMAYDKNSGDPVIRANLERVKKKIVGVQRDNKEG